MSAFGVGACVCLDKHVSSLTRARARRVVTWIRVDCGYPRPQRNRSWNVSLDYIVLIYIYYIIPIVVLRDTFVFIKEVFILHGPKSFAIPRSSRASVLCPNILFNRIFVREQCEAKRLQTWYALDLLVSTANWAGLLCGGKNIVRVSYELRVDKDSVAGNAVAFCCNCGID